MQRDSLLQEQRELKQVCADSLPEIQMKPLTVSVDEYATALFSSHGEQWFRYAVYTLALALPLGDTERYDLRTKSDLYFLGTLFRREATVVAALAAMDITPTEVLLYNSKRGSLLESLNHVFGYRNSKEHGKDTSGLLGLVLYLEKMLEFLRLFIFASVEEPVLTIIKTAEREILLAVNHLQGFVRDMQSGRPISGELTLSDVSNVLCKRSLDEVVRVASPKIAACRLTKWDFDHLDRFKNECGCSRTLWYHHLKGRGEERARIEASLRVSHGAQWEDELRATFPLQEDRSIAERLTKKIQHEAAAALFGDCAECRAVMASCHELKSVCSHMHDCSDCRGGCDVNSLSALTEFRNRMAHTSSSLPLTWEQHRAGEGFVEVFLHRAFDELDAVEIVEHAIKVSNAIVPYSACSESPLASNVHEEVSAYLHDFLLPMSFDVTTRALEAASLDGDRTFSKTALKSNKAALLLALASSQAQAIQACRLPSLAVEVDVHSNTPSTGFGAVVLRTEVPLVGRDVEFREIVDLLSVPGAHRVGLTGPPGIGKSFLAQEVARRAHKHEGETPCFDIVYILNGLDNEAFKRDFDGLAQVLLTAGKIQWTVESEEGRVTNCPSEREECSKEATRWLETDPSSEKVLLVVDDLSPDVQLSKFIPPSSSASVLVTAKSNVVFAQHAISTEKALGSLSVESCLHICESLGVDQDVLALQSFKSFLEKSLSCHPLSVGLAALKFVRPRGLQQPAADFVNEKCKLWVAEDSVKTASAFKPDYPGGLVGSIRVAVARLSKPSRLALEATVLLIPSNEKRHSNAFQLEVSDWNRLVHAALESRMEKESKLDLGSDLVRELEQQGLAVTQNDTQDEQTSEVVVFAGVTVAILCNELLPISVRSFEVWKVLLSTKRSLDVVDVIEQHFDASSFSSVEREDLLLLIAKILCQWLTLGRLGHTKQKTCIRRAKQWMAEYERVGKPSEVLAVLHEVCLHAGGETVDPRRAVDIRITLNGGDPNSIAVVDAMLNLAMADKNYRRVDSVANVMESVSNVLRAMSTDKKTRTPAFSQLLERVATVCGGLGMKVEAIGFWSQAVTVVKEDLEGEDTVAEAAVYERMADVCYEQDDMGEQARRAAEIALGIRAGLTVNNSTKELAAAHWRIVRVNWREKSCRGRAVDAYNDYIDCLHGKGSTKASAAVLYESLAYECIAAGGMETQALEAVQRVEKICEALTAVHEDMEYVAAAEERMAAFRCQLGKKAEEENTKDAATLSSSSLFCEAESDF